MGVLAALEEVMLPALRRPPAVVSFSGGRDSSAILAVATDVARRHGLDDPVPAIMRFPDAPATDETEWQELVLGHLGIRDPDVIELRDELDALGPTASAILDRRGVRWPGNAYLHEPVLERASGGSLLTGLGGDELFGSGHRPTCGWCERAGVRNRGDLKALTVAALPPPCASGVVAEARRAAVPLAHGISLRGHQPRDRPRGGAVAAPLGSLGGPLA